MRMPTGRTWIFEIVIALFGALAVFSMGGGWTLVIVFVVLACLATIASKAYRSNVRTRTDGRRSTNRRR